MKIRPVVTATLLAFVVFAVGAIVIKEARRAQRTNVFGAELQRPAAAAPLPGESARSPRETVIIDSAIAPEAMAITPAQPALVKRPHTPNRRVESTPSVVNPRRVVLVTYFYTTMRCVSCYKIEAFSEAAVSSNFSAALATGDLVWRVVNIDEPGNEHYVNDYKLFTKSVIVSEVVDGTEVRFKNLDRVWKLLGDEQAFARYVVDEVGSFVERS